MRVLVLVLLLVLCCACVDRTVERATIIHTTCSGLDSQCFTVVKFKDGTIRRRPGEWGKKGDQLWIYKCSRGKKVGWCNP